MEIELIGTGTIEFSTLTVGDTFLFRDDVFMVTSNIDTEDINYNACCLSTGEIDAFVHCAMVKPIKCKLVQIG